MSIEIVQVEGDQIDVTVQDNDSISINILAPSYPLGTLDHTQLFNIGVKTHPEIDSHIADLSNPHQVTKSQIGLGNADNTSDLNKPISTATQVALDGKYNQPTGTTSQYIRGNGSIAEFPETVKLTTTVYNKTGAPIAQGKVVYINGAHGNLPTITLAQANSESSSSKTYGMTQSTIGDNSSGSVVAMGLVSNLDTQLIPEGVPLYLSPSVPGGITTVKPSAPDHMVFIGFCTRSHPTQGTIELKIQNGFELEELHNVSISSIQNGQVIKYESSSSLWKNVTLVKGDVGLSNVDNTSDLSKPISTATQDALDLKYDSSNPAGYVDASAASLAAPVQSVAGKTGAVLLAKVDVGLSNVDNTSDINKPVSIAQNENSIINALIFG